MNQPAWSIVLQSLIAAHIGLLLTCQFSATSHFITNGPPNLLLPPHLKNCKMLDNNKAIFLTMMLILIVVFLAACVGNRWLRAQTAVMRQAKLAEREYAERMAAERNAATDSTSSSSAAPTSTVV